MTLSGLALFGTLSPMTEEASGSAELPKIKVMGQMEHALELLHQSDVTFPLWKDMADLRVFILNTVHSSMPPRLRGRAFEVAHAVITEANRYNLDPVFLLAVIRTESQFNLHARGTHGEVGLMQILPDTADGWAARFGLGAKYDLKDPAINIHIGAAHLASLRQSFQGRASLYLGAYNLGATKVRKLLAAHVAPVEYPRRVLTHYADFYRSLQRGQPDGRLDQVAYQAH